MPKRKGFKKEVMLCLGKKSSKAEITSQEKRSRDFMDGFHEEVESKRKVVKRREDGLIAVHVVQKMDQNLAEEKMHLKEQKEDVGRLVLLVKHINEGRVHLELD